MKMTTSRGEEACVGPASLAPPPVIAPFRPTIFADRAQRFDEIAGGHPLGDWLRFLARLTRAQHMVLQALDALPLPDASAIETAAKYRMPPLPAREWHPSEAWNIAVHALAEEIAPNAPIAVQLSLAHLNESTMKEIDTLALRVLRNEFDGADARLSPFVAAALQVVWTAAAASLGSNAIRPIDAPGLCPCCGSPPVASVLRRAGDVDNLRYLHCSLCNTQWNLARVTCTSCAGVDRVAYWRVTGSDSPLAFAMHAETCDACKSYLKILSREKAPRGDPIADDLATLALDVMVDEAGFRRAGPNLLFVAGA